MADFNGDGIPDIVLAREGGTDELEVQFGDGDGGFGSQVTLNGPNQAYSVQTADLNGDGFQDFVAMPTTGNEVFSYLNNGSGAFTLGSSDNWGANYEYGALADVNGDGNIDIIGSSGTDVAVRFGAGNGTFSGQTSLASPGGTAFEVQLTDIDQNGTLDLIYNHGNQVSVQRGGGDGTFGPVTTLSSLGGQYNGLRVADMNSDGLNDIIVGSTNDFVGIYYGQSGGNFSAGTTFNSPNDIGQNSRGFLDVGDLNGDGNLDVIVSEKANGTVGVLLNNGSGQLTYDQSVTIGSTDISNPLLVDLNSDGVLDILTPANGSIFSNLSNTEIREEEFNSLGTISVATPELARESMDILDRALQALAKTRGVIGAYQTRIEAAVKGLRAQEEGATSAESTIRDADVMVEQSELARLSIRVSAATALLAQSQELRNRALQVIQDETIR